jgi:hypothetical protein
MDGIRREHRVLSLPNFVNMALMTIGRLPEARSEHHANSIMNTSLSERAEGFHKRLVFKGMPAALQ